MVRWFVIETLMDNSNRNTLDHSIIDQSCLSPRNCKEANNYYDAKKEWLNFEESNICLYVNHLRRVHLTGAVVIQHYRLNESHSNCYQDKLPYLHCIFKEYLVRGHLNAKQENIVDQQRQCLRRNRTSFIAQFQPFEEQHKKANMTEDWLPTYAVSYEIEMINNDDDEQSENIVQISFRPITRHSFLINALNSFCKPVLGQTIRRCLIIESNRNVDSKANNPFVMRACMMAITSKQQMVDKRLFLVAKNGWLVVFLNSQADAFLLLENEYLIFDGELQKVPIFYERILDTNQANEEYREMFYRRTSINHDQYSCNGMIVTRGVIQNEFKQDSFTLIGLGNAIINLTYFQQLLTISNDSHHLLNIK